MSKFDCQIYVNSIRLAVNCGRQKWTWSNKKHAKTSKKTEHYILRLKHLHKQCYQSNNEQWVKIQQTTFWNIFLFFPEKDFDISCKLETMCMKCQSLVSCQLLNLLNVNGTISITHVLGMYRVQFSFLFFLKDIWISNQHLLMKNSKLTSNYMTKHALIKQQTNSTT